MPVAKDIAVKQNFEGRGPRALRSGGAATISPPARCHFLPRVPLRATDTLLKPPPVFAILKSEDAAEYLYERVPIYESPQTEPTYGSPQTALLRQSNLSGGTSRVGSRCGSVEVMFRSAFRVPRRQPRVRSRRS